jgi:type IV pilus biogenesis protein CpaD/CtpE
MFVLACIAFGGLAGCAGAVALDRWIRTVRPRDYTAITGQDPVTRLPVEHAAQLIEARRRAGTPVWRTRP